MEDRTLLALREAVCDAKAFNSRGGCKRWPPLDPEEIKRLREVLRLSQAEFARRFGFDLGTLKHWEGRRRVPEQASCLLLQMIACQPNAVASLIRQVEQRVEEKQLEPA